MTQRWIPCQCCTRQILTDRIRERRRRDGASPFKEMLFDCFAIKIPSEEGDNLRRPIVCKVCTFKLKQCYVFKLAVIRSQATLKNAGFHKSLFHHDFTKDFNSTNIKYKWENNASNDTDSDDGFAFNENLPLKIYFAAPQDEELSLKSDISNRIKPERKNHLSQVNTDDIYHKSSKRNQKDKKYSCDVCDKRLVTLQGFLKHIDIHKGMHECDKCTKTFADRKHLDAHAQTHADLNKCPICAKVVTKRSYRRHVNSHDSRFKFSFPCSVRGCTERFKYVQHRYCHMNEVHNVDVYKHKCSLCPKAFYLKCALGKHLQNKHGDVHFCNICHERLSSKEELRKHVASSHSGYFKCDTCFKGYETRRLLEAHSVSHEAMRKCPTCEKVISKAAFKRHVDAHGKKPAYSCPVAGCEERFVNIHHRYLHMGDVHKMDIYKYKCDMCPKVFFLNSVLKEHIKNKHNQERNSTCDVCGFRSRGAHQLKDHMLKHSGEKTHQCSACPKAFLRRKTLLQHMKIHNSFRALKCPVCGDGFTQRVSLRGHLLRVHGQVLKSSKDNGVSDVREQCV